MAPTLSPTDLGKTAPSRARRVLMIQPGRERTWQRSTAMNQLLPHIGLAYVAAAVRAAGHEVCVIDGLAEGLDRKAMLQRIRDFDTEILAITANTSLILNAHDLARAAKADNPTLRTVIAGYHATAIPEQTLEEFPAFDFAIYGEGELTLTELLAKLDAPETHEHIRGLVARFGGDLVKGPSRPFIHDLDALPLPAYDLLPFDSYYGPWTPRPMRTLSVSTARGCPYKCVFCQNPAGLTYRRRSVESTIEELAHVSERYNPEMFIVTDETFTVNRKRTIELCEALLSSGLTRKFGWFCETRVDAVDPELLGLMKRAGCHTIFYGVETGNDEVLAASNKRIDRDQARDAMAWSREAGIRSHTGYILGHPFETPESIDDTIQFAIDIDSDSASFSIMVPFPGTEVRRMAQDGVGGLRLVEQGWEGFARSVGGMLELDGLSRAKLERMRLKAFRRFYLRPTKIGTLPRTGRIQMIPAAVAHAARMTMLQLTG